MRTGLSFTRYADQLPDGAIKDGNAPLGLLLQSDAYFGFASWLFAICRCERRTCAPDQFVKPISRILA
jgi:hypothetical protein